METDVTKKGRSPWLFFFGGCFSGALGLIVIAAIALLVIFQSVSYSGAAIPVTRVAAVTPAPTVLLSTPTPVVMAAGTPSALPQPTAAPQPTQATLPLGSARYSYPVKLVVDGNDIVTAEILAPPQAVALTGALTGSGRPAVLDVRTQSARTIEQVELALYPMMSASLTSAGGIEVTGPQNTKLPFDHASWTWNVAAKKRGPQTLTLAITGEMTTQEGQKLDNIPAKTITREIPVEDKPILGQLVSGLANNLLPILGTGGPLGLLLAVLTFRSNQRNSEMKDKIQALEQKLKEPSGNMENHRS